MSDDKQNDEIECPECDIIGDLADAKAPDPKTAAESTRRILSRRKVGGRYVVQREIARGGMGVIHSVYDQDLRRKSALKVVSGALLKDERRLVSFVKEARITALLEHPNIIPVHEIGMNKSTGQPFYTMKCVEGEPLSHVIYKCAIGDRHYNALFNRHRLLDVFRKVCDAVSYAHSKGVIHRDLKPENIMVGDFGEVQLMDWGLAKYISDKESDQSTTTSDRLWLEQCRDPELAAALTQDGVIKGSLAYMAPEQAYGDLNEIDQQTDIFLLGATLYHILTYHPPYYGDTLEKLLTQAEKCDFTPPNAKNPQAQIPLALERVILKAMAPLKVNRYDSVVDMIADLDAFISGQRVCGRQIFSPGEKIIEYGDLGHDTYVIIEGSVQVNRVINGIEQPIAVLGRGDIIGEMAGINHQSRSATVVALETTQVLVITHELMLEELEKLPPWMEKIVFSLTDRVRDLDGKLHPLMLRNRAYPVVNQLYYILASAETYEYKESLHLSKRAVCDEIMTNLGIDRESVVNVLGILLENRLIEVKDKRLVVPDLGEFSLFVDYCRYKFEITGGVKEIRQIELPPEQDSYFRQVLRSLRALQVQDESHQHPLDSTCE